ncbi:MAG: hypothetical protein ACR2PL_09550 [Dehalococcoidia bacterium]
MAAIAGVSTAGGLQEVPSCPLGEEVLRWLVERLWTGVEEYLSDNWR